MVEEKIDGKICFKENIAFIRMHKLINFTE